MSKTYSELLRDPRWQKKRLEIMQRDEFTCRRCKSTLKTLNVHHANGYHNGLAPWEYPSEELVTLCEDCHAKEHEPKTGLNIYLAGKIHKGDWRNEIVKDDHYDRAGGLPFDAEEPIGSVILEKSIFGQHHYCGPFFISCDHGCAHTRTREEHGQEFESDNAGHGRSPVGCGEGSNFSGRNMAFSNCLENMVNCDLFFAFITSIDCYGTLAEIGYAFGLGKPIYIALEKDWKNDLWFALKMATKYDTNKDPKDALMKAIQSYDTEYEGP